MRVQVIDARSPLENLSSPTITCTTALFPEISSTWPFLTVPSLRHTLTISANLGNLTLSKMTSGPSTLTTVLQSILGVMLQSLVTACRLVLKSSPLSIFNKRLQGFVRRQQFISGGKYSQEKQEKMREWDVWGIIFGMFGWNRIYLLLNRMMRNDVRVDMTSHTQLPEVEPQTSTYSTVTCQNYLIRVLTKNYQRNVHLVFYCCFLWVILAFAASVLLMSKAVHVGPFPFFVVIAVGFLPLNAFALYKYEVFGLGFALSSIFFNVIAAAISIIIAMYIPFASIAFGIYLIMEITANCILMQNKGKIMLKTLLLLQIFIICLKLDNTITFSWDQVMFGFIIISLFFLLVSLCLFAYSFLIGSWCLRENFHEIKRIGLRFLACNFLSGSALISIPLWSVYVNDNYYAAAICSILLSYISAIFTFFKRTEIALFLCESFQVPKKEATFKIEAKDTFGMKNLFQVSSNWFLQRNQTTCAGDLQIEQCVVCMNSAAETVWRPCGHCILCHKCMNDLIATENIRCPLCKTNPTEIVKLSKKTELNAAVLARNEYEIETCISIKHI